MEKGSKIKPTRIDTSSPNIKPSQINETHKVSFNFSRLHCKESKFYFNDRETPYFLKLIERLKCISEMTRKEMTVVNSNSLRCHRIDFVKDKVSENTFGLKNQDIEDDAWQFQLTSNEHGRVHGYFILNVFYVVWLDPNHELYPGQK